MAPLRLGEVEEVEQPSSLVGVVIVHRSLQSLPLRRRLTELPSQPAQEAHLGLLSHRAHYATAVDTYLAIASRRDERKYESDALPAEQVRRILDAGRLSGSASNRQPWVFVVVETLPRVEALARAVFAPENVLGAALVVAVVVAGKGPVSFDAGRAAQNMLLAAWNEGFASCPNGLADSDAAREALGLGDEETPVIVLTFGRPERRRDADSRPAAEWSERANRKPLDELVRRR